jgi:PIN domain nuclease of toxin-antitoxin system
VRLLLDTNTLIALVDARLHTLEGAMRDAITDAESVVHASVASLWEIAIKVRLGKLALGLPPKLLPELIEQMGLKLVAINHHHVLTIAEPEPATRDPFDRLLLAQCVVENLRLVTIDRALITHPLAWRAG